MMAESAEVSAEKRKLTGEEEDTANGESKKVKQEGASTEQMEAASSSKQKPVDERDALSYINDDLFTSEIFKIKITNLPKFGFSELKNRLHKEVGIQPHKIKSSYDKSMAYVCYKNEGEKQDALKKLNGLIWRGRALKAQPADPAPDPYYKSYQVLKKTRHEKKLQGSLREGMLSQDMSEEEAELLMKNHVTPLWKMPYSQQLQEKTLACEEVLRKLTLHHFVRPLQPYKDRHKYDGMPCPLLPIVPSPVTEEYRNKNEFSIGYGIDGKTLIVGNRYGMYKSGNTAVGSSRCLSVCIPKTVAIAEAMQEIVQESGLAPFTYQTHVGHWQHLTVKLFTTGQSMCMVDFVVDCLGEEKLEEVKTSIRNYFTNGKGKELDVTSFYVRWFPSRHRFADTTKRTLLFGEEYVYENVLGHKFRVSPEAFFQVNTLAAEKLYSLVTEWSGASKDTVVFDICCGTGTIGLSLAKKVKEVIGIDLCESSIDDARENAKLNAITNATFYCSKVENIIGKIMTSFPPTKEKNLVAILDPPRPGIYKTVIKALRKNPGFQRLVFMSCNPELCMDNFADLIRLQTNNLPGVPFNLVRAVPVDLFPGTKHIELILLFERDTTQTAASS